MLRFREAQVRALEEMEEKHQAMSEEAQQEKEQEKKLLMTVCAHVRYTLHGAAAESRPCELSVWDRVFEF